MNIDRALVIGTGGIGSAVAASERFYPAFHLCAFGDTTPTAALQAAIAEAYGRA